MHLLLLGIANILQYESYGIIMLLSDYIELFILYQIKLNCIIILKYILNPPHF